MEHLTAHLKDGTSLVYFPHIKVGEGTEKILFATEDEHLLIGFYKDREERKNAERIKQLECIIEKYNPCTSGSKSERWEDYFCWPKAIVIKPQLGILVPRFTDHYYFQDTKQEKKAKWFSNPNVFQKLHPSERGDWKMRLIVCRQLSKAIGRMHMAGLSHSDLSGNNILMDLKTGSCMIIDIDALVVRGIFPSKVLGTKGYMAPEIVSTSTLPLSHPKKQLPNILTDLHSLAVFIYQILLLRHPLEGKKIHSNDPMIDDMFMYGEKAVFVEHPSDNSNQADIHIPYTGLGEHLVKLIERAFIEGLQKPDRRPTAYEWEKAITKTLDMLYPCKGKECWNRWFICQKGMETRCSHCGWKPDHQIPIMHFFSKYMPGQYITEKHFLTIWDEQKVYQWQTISTPLTTNLMEKEKVITASFQLNDHKWMLKNETNHPMIYDSWKSLPSGHCIEIKDKLTLLLHPSGNGKLVMFDFL